MVLIAATLKTELKCKMQVAKVQLEMDSRGTF